MKKPVWIALAAAALVFALAACGGRTAADMPGAQIANPFADYATLEEAAAAAGFPLSAPSSISGYDAPVVQLMSGKMLQLIFKSGDQRLIIRKAKGSEDISGDYTAHSETRTVRINGANVSLRGAEGKVSAAVWCAGGYSYALLSDVPMAPDVMTDLIAEIA